MQIFTDSEGNVIYRSANTYATVSDQDGNTVKVRRWPSEAQARQDAAASGVDLTGSDHYEIEADGLAAQLTGGQKVVTIEGGQVASVEPAPGLPEVYLHFGITGGDGMDPPGIINDGADALTVDISLRGGPGAADPVIPVSGIWRVAVRDEGGDIYDVVKVAVAGGQATVSYTSSQRPAICKLEQRDLDTVESGGVTYRVVLAGDTAFRVYREL